VNKSSPRSLSIPLRPILLALAFSGALAWAGAGGDISGTVTDSSGAAAPHAQVSALNMATGVRTAATTDTQGFYSLASLPVGQYDVLVELAGFKPYRRTGVVIDANGEIRVDAALTVGDATKASPFQRALFMWKPPAPNRAR
jgi:hypothetical protein